MENKVSFICCLLCLFTYITSFPAVEMIEEVDAVKRQHGKHKQGDVKLFVFGDSYVDTGNWPKSMSSSWKEPYGLTYPGSPSGRFSDGFVLTDFIASFLGITSPQPYTNRKRSSERDNGVNFAYGGTGVFNTFVNQPNMTTQINYFQQLLQEEEQVYTKENMSSSIALVSVAGNDYATFLTKKGNKMEELGNVTNSIMSQLELNLRRIHGLGVQKIGITAMEPIGCLPKMTAFSSYENCSESANSLSRFHNQILHQTIEKLNNQTTGTPVFFILDLYTAFMSALDIQQNHPGNSNFENPLKPCCIGTSSEYSCGDKRGMNTKYLLCRNPELSFFWDVIHPSQQGWFAVFSALKPSLSSLL